MKLADLLALPASLAAVILATAAASPPSHAEYGEHLTLRPLPQGYLYAGFNFTSSTPLSAYHAQHYQYFPRSLAQILQFSHTKELHLRFALGRWDEDSWGGRPRDGQREGGTGVEIWAWINTAGRGGKGRERDDSILEDRWSNLVNSLSGLFCASLNFIDATRTTSPILSFTPEGTHSLEERQGMRLLHGTLPHEVVCTENLTPFLKLLPCKGKAGISSLLDGHKVFDANWQTMAVDVRPVCKAADGQECAMEIQQTVDLVLDIERSMRPRDNPIPRPPPIEEVQCDETKPYHGHDTCFPKPRDGEMAWSMSGIFGSAVKGACHLSDARDGAGADGYQITLQVPAARTINVSNFNTGKSSAISSLSGADARHFRLGATGAFDLQLSAQNLDAASAETEHVELPFFASRHITGHGQQRGGMHANLHNPRPDAQRIVYLESLPWFLRPYMHTLRLEVSPSHLDSPKPQAYKVQPEKFYYVPAIDRKRGTHLELLLTLPANSTLELTYEFEKALLRYTEYPPDANRGFDVAPAVIRVLPPIKTLTTRSSNAATEEGDARLGQGSYYLRTTALLLPLPTPDFSMPYNVIILTSTVLALGFGSLFNLLVRRLVLAEEAPVSPLKNWVRQGRARVSERVACFRRWVAGSRVGGRR